MKHPYSNLRDSSFWYKAMTLPAPGHVDPVTNFGIISSTDKISTIGSCFAQHLSKKIASKGFNYFVPEQAPIELSQEESRKRNFGVFSARYGNVYTARQALQLFDRAYGSTRFSENIWVEKGRYIDGFRPQIEPNGFDSEKFLQSDRLTHFAAVRRVFEESDWIIFTLGLTEAWQSRKDGTIFPIAPGVAGGVFDEDKHEFVNFKTNDVIADLEEFVTKLTLVNPSVKILLTVSPVPLVATYEKRHVLVSNTVSKSVLRVAADEVERAFDNVIYFPSYEIITSPANSGKYYQDDLRRVTDIGIDHVMRVFSKHFLVNQSIKKIHNESVEVASFKGEFDHIVCEEEEIQRAIKQSNF